MFSYYNWYSFERSCFVMDYKEVLEKARPELGKCKGCPVCNGKACGNLVPGPGAKGSGTVSVRNYDKWREILLNMDTICPGGERDTSIKLFGKKFALPVFAGPVGLVQVHYAPKYDDVSYYEVLVKSCAEAGIAAFTGDGVVASVMENGTRIIKDNGGIGVPTMKPWGIDVIKGKLDLIRKCGCFAMAMDIDGAGLPFLKGQTPPAGSKSLEELKEIIDLAGVPFIVKGIMTVKGALKAKEAGAQGIVVSNHGGRVLDGVPSTAEVLEEIAGAVKGEMKIFVDGGIRSGLDVFRALALGADAVIICRPFVNACFGADAEGIKIYIDKIAAELKDAMEMCGARSLAEITKDMVSKA